MKTKIVFLLLMVSMGFIKTEAQLRIDSMYLSNSTNCKVCNGKAYSLVSGGTSPYTYRWSNGATTLRIDSNLCPGRYYLKLKDAKGDSAIQSFTIGGAKITPVIYCANAGCHSNNGYVSASATGGTSPYTYLWSNGGTANHMTGLSAGKYVVTITDVNGCSVKDSITVLGALNVSISATGVSCYGKNDGKATASASGGVSPYTYSWKPTGGTNQTATGLSAGTYTVMVTDSGGCTGKDSITITQPYPIHADSVQITPATCNSNNGSAFVSNIVGGTGPYAYSWSPSGGTNNRATGLSAGTYTLTVTDHNGCSSTTSVVIPSKGLVATIYHSNTGCNNNTGYASASVTGGTSPYTYLWSNGVTSNHMTGLSAGKYVVTITDAHGCSVKDSVNILSALTVSISATGVSCYGKNDGKATASASGGISPYKYSWKPSGGTNQTATGLSAGTYTVEVTDSAGCAGKDSITITQPNPIHADSLRVTPASCNSNNGSAELLAIQGGTSPYTYKWSPSGGTSYIATGLSGGTYTVTITDHNGCSSSTSVTITSKGPVAVIYHSNTGCNSKTGYATAYVTGGTSPYTYLWSNGATSNRMTGLSAGKYVVTITDANGCSVKDSVTIIGALTVSISATGVSCYGKDDGKATASASGGVSPYTYSWKPSGGTNQTATGLSAGTYTVEVTDSGGCAGKDSITITQPYPIRVDSLRVTSASCNSNNGSAEITKIQGGTSPYTYMWSPSGGTSYIATGLSAGTYTITITDHNGCSTSTSVTITSKGLTAALYHSNTGCNNNTGYATAYVTGGTSPYTYLWSNGVTSNHMSGLSAGKYVVTITDANGCSVKDSVTILAGLTVSISATNDSCYGKNDGKATASASGGVSPYTYSWKPSGGTNQTATGLSAGTYTVTVTDNNGCSGKDSATITEPKPLTLMVRDTVVPDSSLCDGIALVYVGGGAKPYTFTWSPRVHAYSDTLFSYAEAADSLCNGEYHVCVTDAHGCSVCDSFHIGHKVLGIAIIEDNEDKLKIYPVPANNELFVQPENIPDASYQLSVYDLMGREILSQKNINLNQGTIIPVDISKIPSGTYMLRVYTTGYNKTAPFIVTH